MDAFQLFLNQLAALLQLDSLAPSKEGACLIIMKASSIPLLFEFDDHIAPNTIVMSTPIIEVDPPHQELYAYRALQLNSSMEETLSLRAEAMSLYLHRRLSPYIQIAELKLIIDKFVERALQTKEIFTHIAQEPLDQTEERAPPQAYRFKV